MKRKLAPPGERRARVLDRQIPSQNRKSPVLDDFVVRVGRAAGERQRVERQEHEEYHDQDCHVFSLVASTSEKSGRNDIVNRISAILGRC